jgi:hypothetical protein
MKPITELLGGDGNNFEKMKEVNEKILLERGYIHNDVYGWEKPEALERYGLNPNMIGVPCKYIEDIEEETKWDDERDDRGNKTGRKVPKLVRKITGKRKLVVCQEWLSYENYCDQKRPIENRCYPLEGIHRS